MLRILLRSQIYPDQNDLPRVISGADKNSGTVWLPLGINNAVRLLSMKTLQLCSKVLHATIDEIDCWLKVEFQPLDLGRQRFGSVGSLKNGLNSARLVSTGPNIGCRRWAVRKWLLGHWDAWIAPSWEIRIYGWEHHLWMDAFMVTSSINHQWFIYN